MKVKRLFNYKNTKFDNELSSIPHNFVVNHDDNKNLSEMTIYGVIGESWYTDDYTSASDVDNALKEANGKDISIRLSSPGGNAFDGIAIHNRLLNYKREFDAKITVHVDGYACSSASLIPLAADNVVMGVGSMYMIHEASVGVAGTKGELRSQADLLEKLEDGILDIYQSKSNLSREELRQMVDNETWFNSHEAVQYGFATSTAAKKEDSNEVVNTLKNQVEMLTSEMEKLKNNIQKDEDLKNNIQKEETTQPDVETSSKRKRFLF